MVDTSVRADSVHATIYNNLMFYDSYDAGRYVPGVIVGVIPSGKKQNGAVPTVLTTDLIRTARDVFVVYLEAPTVFKLFITAPGFHEEHYVWLEPNKHYDLMQLCGSYYMEGSDFQDLYEMENLHCRTWYPEGSK